MQDAFKRWYPASLTKLMTAYVTFRAIAAGEVAAEFADQDDEAFRRRAAEQDGLQARPVMRLDNALKMMLVKSANDVAMADRRECRRLAGRLRRPHERRGARGSA